MFLTLPSHQPTQTQFSPSQSFPHPTSTCSIPTVKKQSNSSLLTQSKQQLLNLKSIENGFYVANLYNRFELIDKALFLLLVINCVGMTVYLELEMKLVTPMTHAGSIDAIFDTSEEERIEKWSTLLLWMNLIVTAVALPISFLRYRLQQCYEIVQKKAYTPILQLYESLLIIIQPLPFINDITLQLPLQAHYQDHIEIKLNLILVIFSIIKFTLIARYLFWHNLCTIVDIRSEKFFRPSYNRICNIYSCEKTYMHVMKCLFKQNFIVFIGGFYLICMTASAYCLRIVETHYDGRFVDIGNCMWFTLLSMTTVGYGDIFVSTPIGIAIDCLLMFSGVVIASLLVSSLNGFFSMGYQEKRSLTLTKRLKDKGELKQLAALFIARCVERNFLQKKYRKRITVSEQQRLYRRLFHEQRMALRCGKEKQLNLYRDMFNQFQSLKLQLNELSQQFQEDIQALSQKQRLTLNRDAKPSISLRNRSSSYFNLIKLKSRDSRVSLMQPMFNNGEFAGLREGKELGNISCGNIESQDQSEDESVQKIIVEDI